MVFAIAALDLLVDILLDITFEDAGPCGLVEACRFQDVRGIDPVVMPPSHNMFLQICAKLELVHGNLGMPESAEGFFMYIFFFLGRFG